MKARFLLLATLVVLAGCQAASNVKTVTVSGTATAPSWSNEMTLPTNVAVSATSGGHSYSTSVPFNGSSGGFSFSIPDVPTGTYSLVITFPTTNLLIAEGTTYSLNGGTSLPVSSEGGSGSSAPYTYTIDINNITINADTTVNLSLPNNFS